MTRAEKKSAEWQMVNHPMAFGGDAFADMIERMNVSPAYVAGYEEREKELFALAQRWINTGYANVITFDNFVRWEEGNENKNYSIHAGTVIADGCNP